MKPATSQLPLTGAARRFLGIEGGGTRTVALLADGAGQLLKRVEAGPANVRLLSDAQLTRHFRALAGAFPRPDAVALGLAGARGETEWARIRAAAARAWPEVPCHATHDLATALMAAGPQQEKGKKKKGETTAPAAVAKFPRVLVLSGTGSCCYGRTPAGREARFGGWGHILGDKGSGFEIGLRALKAVVYYLDRDGEWSPLGARILRTLQLNEPDELIGWVQRANKTEIAALAEEVFAAWAGRDRIASDILTGAAESLARDAVACARRLTRSGPPVQFVFAGGILLKQPRFARLVARRLKASWPGARVTPLQREGAWGAVELAQQAFQTAGSPPAVKPAPPARPPADSSLSLQPASLPLSPTEQRHPLSRNLDRMPLAKAIRLMLSEDAKIPAAVLAERARIGRVIGWIVRAFRRGGRLFYVGAGTSGRLGILDASECPPTFRSDPEMVQGIIAGGRRAIWQAVEGAEDEAAAGAQAVRFRRVSRRDVVIGIAASGRTPFVWGALRAARRAGAATALVCFNPALRAERGRDVDVIIAPEIGPEILTGSTRLKAGTATKLILNLFTTLAFVRGGKVVGNLMVDLNPSNVKLRDRAVRIVRELTGADAATALAALEKSGWVVKAAWQRLKRRAPKVRESV